MKKKTRVKCGTKQGSCEEEKRGHVRKKEVYF